MDFDDFVRDASPSLVRTAYLLTGDAQRAEDLVQEALSRMWPRWDRIADGGRQAYARRVMVRLNARWGRRRWSHEVPTDTLPDPVGLPDEGLDLDLVRALADLPLRQRQSVVLRFADDLPVDEVARLMGCSPGAVKSHTSRGLAALREALAAAPESPRTTDAGGAR